MFATIRQLSQASPTPSPSISAWLALALFGQLSMVLFKPAEDKKWVTMQYQRCRYKMNAQTKKKRRAAGITWWLWRMHETQGHNKSFHLLSLCFMQASPRSIEHFLAPFMLAHLLVGQQECEGLYLSRTPCSKVWKGSPDICITDTSPHGNCP